MKHLDLTYLLENVTDDIDFIKHLLSVFLNSLEGDLESLDSSIYQRDHGKIKRAAHKIKSSFRSLGMDLMTKRLQEIEDMGHNNFDIRVIDARYSDFKRDLPIVIDEVNEYIRK